MVSKSNGGQEDGEQEQWWAGRMVSRSNGEQEQW
jgi:hypothetical protein